MGTNPSESTDHGCERDARAAWRLLDLDLLRERNASIDEAPESEGSQRADAVCSERDPGRGAGRPPPPGTGS
jgi:hypothetical protein